MTILFFCFVCYCLRSSNFPCLSYMNRFLFFFFCSCTLINYNFNCSMFCFCLSNCFSVLFSHQYCVFVFVVVTKNQYQYKMNKITSFTAKIVFVSHLTYKYATLELLNGFICCVKVNVGLLDLLIVVYSMSFRYRLHPHIVLLLFVI